MTKVQHPTFKAVLVFLPPDCSVSPAWAVPCVMLSYVESVYAWRRASASVGGRWGEGLAAGDAELATGDNGHHTLGCQWGDKFIFVVFLHFEDLLQTLHSANEILFLHSSIWIWRTILHEHDDVLLLVTVSVLWSSERHSSHQFISRQDQLQAGAGMQIGFTVYGESSLPQPSSNDHCTLTHKKWVQSSAYQQC